MDTKHLTTFVKLAQTLNYQKAARSLQYSPSTLFKHVQLLGVAIVALTYRWKRNTLLSIALGTVGYMLLIHLPL